VTLPVALNADMFAEGLDLQHFPENAFIHMNKRGYVRVRVRVRARACACVCV